MGEQFCLKWNNHQNTLISIFDTLLETERHVDCSLAAEGKVLKAHKVVLSACSPYLENLLNQHQDKYPVLIFNDVKYDELKAMLDYMYRGEVNVLQDQLNGFLKAAESLQIKGLTDQGGGGGGNGGGGGAISEPKRKQPRMSERSESPAVMSAQDRSMSPTIPQKRRRQRRLSQEQAPDSHIDTSNSCDMPPSTPPIVTKPQIVETDRISAPPPAAPAPSPIVKTKIEPPEMVIQPKTEYMDELNDEQIEDLTLDDDDDDGNYMAKPGSSHGNDSQGYDPNWQYSGDTSNPDMFLGAQDASGNQNNSQDLWPGYKPLVEIIMGGENQESEAKALEKKERECRETGEEGERYECQTCGRSYKHYFHLKAHKRECSIEPLFRCEECHKRFYHSRNLGRHMQNVHKQSLKKKQNASSETAQLT